MLESSYSDFKQRKETEEQIKRREEEEQLNKFKRDLEIEAEEKRQRKEEYLHYGECLRNQMTMKEAKQMVYEEQVRALKTSDPREREEIIRRLKEKIKMIVKCKRCQRVISQRIIEV